MTTMDVRGSVDLSTHGINPTGRVALEPDDRRALRARGRARRGADRRGRPARRRHRQAHGPLAEGQVRRARAGLRGPHLVGGQQGVRRGRVRPPARQGHRLPRREESLYVVDAFAGADPEHRIAVRVITTHPYHALFAKTLFIDPDRRRARRLRAAGARAARARARGRSRTRTARARGTFVVLHPGTHRGR